VNNAKVAVPVLGMEFGPAPFGLWQASYSAVQVSLPGVALAATICICMYAGADAAEVSRMFCLPARATDGHR
jgi:hypothetical protein